MSELENFVLSYMQEVDGIVEPPVYGAYEVLLPEAVAARWRVSDYLQLTFTSAEQDDVIQLGYNHPLVEQMVQEAHGRSASACLNINNLRLNKRDVDDLATKNWVILNARVQPQKRSAVARVRSTYVRFNFKAAILSDEKQERLVSVLMDAHTGSRVADSRPIERAATAVSPDAILTSLADGPMRWQSKNHPLKAPLAEATLMALLEQAQMAVLQEMQTDLSTLQKRVARFRQLDEARLIDYYSGLEKDLQTRLKNASTDRRPGLQDKLTAVQTERRHKLADLAEHYQVRINLVLLNLLVIQQPKLIQAVEITNRSTQVSTYAVWDPLLHQLEPMPCQVCGQPGQRMYLCYNGHLAHENCLAPTCIDCKRVFCHDCAHEIGSCDVCHEPLCHHSQLTCPDCGRHTCQAHRDLCHGDNGRPIDLARQPLRASEPAPSTKPEPPTTTNRKHRTKKTAPKSKPQSKSKRKSISSSKKGPKPLRMEVVLLTDTVAAYLLGKRGREIAIRTWELAPDEGGVLRNCQCEKGESCQANRMVIRPWEHHEIETQIREELAAFAAEYQLPLQKIHYNRLSSLSSEPYSVPQFQLIGLWKNESAISTARETFARLYWR